MEIIRNKLGKNKMGSNFIPKNQDNSPYAS